jgi:elongation factor Ts
MIRIQEDKTMANITAALVKELREITGAGMMDCKKALAATEGNMDKAVDFLREKGLAGAQKKAGRIAAEGVVDTKIAEDGKKGVVVEVNAETDFVAKNEKFKTYVAEVAAQALASAAAGIEGFMEEKWALDPTMTVAEKLSSMISIIGENMHIRRYEVLEEAQGFIESYIHAGGKIGVLLDIESDVVNAEVKEMAKNICMQVAALKPLYVSAAEISADFIEKEKEILKAQIMNDPKEASKPEKVILGMIQGRINKELKDICLLDQIYVKAEDGKQSVKAYIDSVAKAQGAKINVKKFIRFETGEGLEKKNENFAEEVAKQMAGK